MDSGAMAGLAAGAVQQLIRSAGLTVGLRRERAAQLPQSQPRRPLLPWERLNSSLRSLRATVAAARLACSLLLPLSSLWRALSSLLSLSLLLAASPLQAETVRLANGEWSPYQSAQLPDGGPVSVLAREAFASQGIQVEYGFLPWRRGFEQARDGLLDGTLVWSRAEGREQYFHFSDPLLLLRTLLFYRRGEVFQWRTKADLAGLRIGGVIGYSYDLAAEERAGLVTVERIADPQGNYRKLLAGRLDLVAEDEAVGWQMVRELGITEQVQAHPKPLKHVGYHLLISRQHPEGERLITAFNAGLRQLKASGRVAELIQPPAQVPP